MKTLTTIKAWILICSIVVSSSATTDHASSHHDVPQHGDSIPQKKHQNIIVPFGIQIPGHVLSTKDVACISADSNIFEIMNKAQETCNGTDMRCTFYHFVNHGYQNIGTLDVDKQLFDDLLMKFDNWLLTAENIEKNNVPLDRKTKEDSSLDTESNSNASETERLYTNQGVHIGKVDHNTNESNDDKKVNTHHIKVFDEKHDRNHHHKLKNGNHIKLVPEYNNDHRYFEVFLPKDKETGKPRTIYIEVDKDKNEFVLLDEEIDKKLNGVKPIRIELDELSEIADTAFNNIPKSLNHTKHIYNSNDDDRIITGDINTHSAITEDTTNLDKDIEKPMPNNLNSSICNPYICNIHGNQQLIPDNMTGNVKKIVNVSKNLVVPNIYINQAQFYVESQSNNITNEIANDHLGFLESTNETDIYETGFYKETPLDTTEFNENNITIEHDLDNVEYSPENFDIPCKNDYDNSTENYELSTEDENVTFDDDSFIEVEENNDTSIDIDFDDTHDFSLSNKLHLNEPILHVENPEQENKLKTFPYIYTEPKLASSLTGISGYTGSQLDEISSENRKEPTDLQGHSSVPSTLLSPYTTVPIFEKDLVKVLETDGHLQSTFPTYGTLDLLAGVSQNTSLNSDVAHPSISSFNSPLESDFGHQTTGHKISTIFPTPPVECVVRLNKGSQYSPLNFGFSWLPSYSRIEELRLPSAVNSSPEEFIMSLSSLDHTTPVEEPRLFQTLPSLSVGIQEPFLTTEPYHDAETIMPPKSVLLSKLGVPNYNTDFERKHTTYPLSETPLSVMPYKKKDVVHSPCPVQQLSPYLHPTKPNLMDLGLIKYSPFDNNSKETMIPYSPCKNRYPYTTIPYFLNPYLKPQYLEPLMTVAPLQPASEIPTLDSLPISLDQSYAHINGDYPRETKPISLLPSTAFPPLNPLLLGPGFIPNTLPCQNLWNNVPYLPSTILSDQNIRNYPPIVNNYLTPSAAVQQNQILKPLLSKAVPDQPCPVKNILEMAPPSYTPFSSVYMTPIQMDLSPSLALERDLQSLSLKYGIHLSKILNSLETEISDARSKTCSPTFEVPYSNLVHDSSLISKPIFSKTNAVLDDENRSVYEESLLETDLSDLVPLDSSLIRPHLEIESSLMLESNDSQNYTVLSETTVTPSSHSNSENLQTTVIYDSSLIVPHLSTLSTSNFVLSDENRDTNEMVKISESDISNLIPLDSSLIGPHLEIGSPRIVLDSINSQGDINKSHTEVPVTISSQIEPKLNIQNQATNMLLDSSLIDSHLPSLSPVKPLLSYELQTINDMIPRETDLTESTPLDSSVIDTQEDFVNKLQQSEILQHEKTSVTLSAATVRPELQKPSEYLPTNLVEEDLLLESDSSRMIPLDSSLIGSELKLGSSPIIIDSTGDKTIPLLSKENLQNIDNKVEELESIILSSSLLPTLLNKPVKADSNLNIITQETKLNEKLDEPSLDSNVELPLTDISLIPFKEKGFKIVEPILELPSLIDDRNIPLLTEDSRTLKHKSVLSDMTHVIDSETLPDSSLAGASILHKLAQPEISTSLDSSIHLDSSLIGPSILQEIDSQGISPILDSVNHFQSSLAATTINQNKKPSEIMTFIDFSVPLESSLKGPTVHHEINSQETSTAFDSVTQIDNSLVSSLYEPKESSGTSHVFGSISQLGSSLKGPSSHQETLEVSRAFASKDHLGSSLIGPDLLTVPFSSDEIKMINEELQPESGLANLVPLDSSLVGPHLYFERDLEQSEISRYQNPETSLISVINPDETTELPCNLLIQTSNISSCNLQPYFNIPLHSQYSEIIEPAPKLVTVPTESPKAFLQQLLSKPCVESPIILPSSSLDTILQLPIASNELNSVPCRSPSEYFTPISPIYTTTLSNAFTNPILPIYASPLSVPFAKPISTPSTSLPLNVPYADDPLIPLPLPINPYTARALTPNFSSPLIPLKITPISDYPNPSTVAQNRPMPSENPYKPSQTYSNPYVPIHASPIPMDTSPGSLNIMSKLPPAVTSPMTPVFYEPLSTPHFSPLPKLLTNLGLPAAPINSQTCPSNLLTPTLITPISPLSSSFSSYNRLNPKITTPELKSRLLNTLPISNAMNPFLNSNQRMNTKTLPIQSHSSHVPKSSPLSNLQIKQNIPLIEEIPSYDFIEESTCTYSDDKDDKFSEEPKLKYPLESLSYTLAPEEITDALPNEDLIKQEDVTPSLNNRASEPFLQTNLYRHLRLKPYALQHGPRKPLLKPHPAPQPSFTESITENIFDNIRLVDSSSPLKHPVSLPTSILSSPLLKPLTPLNSAPNFPISSPVLHSPRIDTYLSPYNKLPMNEKLQSLSSSPYYSTPSQDMSSSPINPRELRNIVTPQVPSAFSQISTNEAFVHVSKSEPPILPFILDNYIQLPSTNHEPKSKTLTSQSSLVKPSPIINYTQYAVPITSHIPSLEMPIPPQYITPLTHAETLKKPLISPKYISSILPPAQTLQDRLPMNEALIHYQPCISPSTAFTSVAKDIFMSPPVTLSYLPSVNMVEPVNTDLNRPQSSLTPQYSVPVSTLPGSKSSPTVSHSYIPYSRISQHIPKQVLKNHIMFTDIDFQTQKNKLSPLNSIPRKIYPSLSLIEPLETVPFYTPRGPLGTSTNPQNILKLKSPLPSVQYTLPLSSAPYLTQPLQSTDSYQTQPLPNKQYATKPHSKLSPVPAQNTTPSSSQIYTSLSLETVPKQPVNRPSIPQNNLPSALVYDSPIYSSSLARNPLINPDFKPVSVIPSCPVPKNIISLPKLIPSENILLSNLRSLDISQDSQNLHSSPITFSTPLTSLSLIKPLANKLPQKLRHYQPQIMPSNSQYVSQLPIDSGPQLLPSTSPLLKSPLLKPLFTISQNNAPLIPMHFSDTNTAFPEVFPIETVPSVTSPDIALSNYFPSDSSNHKYSGLYDSLVAEIPEVVTPVNPSLTTTNIPLYSNYDILEPPPKLQIKANIINTAKPVELSAMSASESSPLSLNSLDTETIEDIEPYELMPDLEDRFSQLPPNQNQQRQLHQFFYPLLNRTSQIFPSKIPSFNAPSPLSDTTEFVDTTDFIPISQIKSEPLISNFAGHSSQSKVSSVNRKVPIPNTLSNIPELDTLQLLPYTTLLNTDFRPPTYKQLPPKSLTSHYNNKIPQSSLIYLSPQEYKDLTQGLSPSQKSSSSPTILSSIKIDPQLTTNPLTVGPRPQISLYTSPMSTTPDDWLQSPIFKNSLPVHEKLIEVTPEKDSIPPSLNKYKPVNKITPQGNNYSHEPKSMVSEVFSELDSVKPVNPLHKSKELYTEYIEDLKSNVHNNYGPESDNVSSNDNKPDVFGAKPTESLPEIIKSLSASNYKAQRPQRLSKLDHFYVNDHIGKSPQICNVPNYNISPVDSLTDVASPYTTMPPEILKDFTEIPTRHFGSVPKLDTNFLSPNEFYTKIADSFENIPTTNSYPQNYLNPCLKYSSQMKSSLNTIELADTSEMIPTSYSPCNNIDDIKYSGYKTYQMPSFKSPQAAHNLGTATQRCSPSVLTYSSPNPSKVQQKPSSFLFYRPTEISNRLIPQYQTPIKMTTPLQTKLDLDTSQETPELNEYYPIEDIPKHSDSTNEDVELKTSLINYINKREDVKNNLFNNNAELTIPIGNIAISKKGPYNANTIESNDPSIGLKVWKSNVKIAEIELKLKFKDLSVNNFMPVVNHIDKYDMEEIRKIVKNYIDEKYGNLIEVNEPYNIDNKYTVIKDFDHNAIYSKFNLLWPTNYV